MLILTIVLAAFAPLITKRKTVDLSNPWRYSTNNSDIYYGLGSKQSAMIGQNSKTSNDVDSKLIIKTDSNTQNHIMLKNGSWYTALRYAQDSILFGGTYKDFANSNNYATSFGYWSMNNITTGQHNTAIGYSALSDLTTADGNTAVGFSAGRYLTGTKNTAVGVNAAGGSASGGGSAANYNTAVGYNALSRTTKEENTAVGYAALSKNTTGYSNTGVGATALETVTSGNNNTGLGARALRYTTTGTMNSAVGNSSLRQNTEGSHNSALGSGASLFNETGSYNTSIGKNALYYNTSGSNNTSIGYNACINVKGSNKTCIGANSGPSSDSTKFATDDVERIYIGSKSNLKSNYLNNDYLSVGDAVLEVHNDTKPYVVINGNLVVRGYTYVATIPQSGDSWYPPMQFERDGWGGSGNNHSTAKLWAGRKNNEQASMASSDRRLKNILGENKSGLEDIRKLKIFNYTFKDDKNKTPRVGVIAQDLQTVFPKAVQKDDKGYLMIRHEDMFYSAINAIKQLDLLVQGLINELKTVIAKLSTHDREIKALQKENQELKLYNKQLEKRLELLEKKI